MKFCLELVLTILIGICLLKCGNEEDSNTSQAFNFKFEGVEFDPHNEQVLTAAVVDRSNGRIVKQESTSVAEGGFSFEWTGLLEASKNYFLDYYVDMNGNGVCDDPQTDHSWRLKIEEVSNDLNFTDTHHTDFKRVCTTFNGSNESIEEGTDLVISGQLSLDEGISEVDGLSAGAAIVGANVFVEGFPEQEVKTDAQGKFALNITVPSAALLANSYQVVMWYTEANANSSIISWDTEAVRIGAKKEISYDGSSNELDIGSVSLQYTKKAKITLIDAVSSSGISNCWVEIPDYGFQLIVKSKGEGTYLVDYLPEGTYKLNFDCSGYEVRSETIQIEKAEKLGEIQLIPTVSLNPSA